MFGDGTQSRCFTDVRDVAAALGRLIDCDQAPGTYNIGSPESVPILALAQLIIERTGSASPVVFVPYAQALGPGFEELGNRAPDTSALRALTGWTPQRGLEATIDSVIADELDRAVVVRYLPTSRESPLADRVRAPA